MPGTEERIVALAASSDLARFRWLDRGRAPAGYVAGMAVAFGRAVAAFRRGEAAAAEMAKPLDPDARRDALTFYADILGARGLGLGSAQERLLALFVLLTGLGMRESSGRHCEGRDRSADNVSAETAEAGLFQVSWNSRSISPLLPATFAGYQGREELLDIFSKGVRCSEADLHNWGEGEGVEFQRLTKACPAFAVDYAAVLLRNGRRHWGPINTRKAEVRPECARLFAAVEQLLA